MRLSALNLAPDRSVSAWRIGALVVVALAVFACGLLRYLQSHAQLALVEAAEPGHAMAAVRTRVAPGGLSVQEQNRVQTLMQSSWDGVLNTLETAAFRAKGGVSIVSLVPKNVGPTGVHFEITAAALGVQPLLAYLSTLRDDPRVIGLTLQGQKAGDRNGPGSVTFVFFLEIDPRIGVGAP